ncbi:MAG: polyphenol oxidase family protein [Desulfovibrionaceae bacterium]
MMNSLPYISFLFPTLPTIECAFHHCTLSNNSILYNTISYDSVPYVEQTYLNKKALLNTLALPHYSENKQVHGTKMLFEPPVFDITSQQDPQIYQKKAREADGLATSLHNIALLIKTADCQPLLFAHSSGKYIMALHVGWKGNALHFPQKAILEFTQHYKISARDVYVVRGPSLSPHRAEFINAHKEWSNKELPFFDAPTKTMNLWKLTQSQLEEVGILSKNIYSIDICTYDSPLFFSYRKNTITGRQASIITIRS